MKHLLAISLLAWTTMVSADPKSAAPPAGPSEAAKVFCTELRERKVDGLPKGEAWVALAPRLTPELVTAFQGAQAEQAEFIKQHPDEKPPWIEGDLFSSLFEGPQSFTVGEARIDGDTAEVPVHATHAEGSDTTRWTDTFVLKKTTKGWLIDDVRYGGTWDFATKGTLKQSLAPGGD